MFACIFLEWSEHMYKKYASEVIFRSVVYLQLSAIGICFFLFFQKAVDVSAQVLLIFVGEFYI